MKSFYLIIIALKLNATQKKMSLINNEHLVNNEPLVNKNNEHLMNIDTIIKKGFELKSEDDECKKNDVFNQNTIYRFKFTEDFMSELYKFSKIHQYDDRKGFKEAWQIWTLENDDIIESEMRRLLRLGYNGDVLDKMFKSARYYFRKKGTEKKEPKQRRQYISVSKELLESMDLHIHNNSFQPKDGFCDFCKNNETLLKDAISKIFEQGTKDKDLIEDKIKKTYKNRYFMIANNK